jgi:hypothetical protein
MSWFKDLFSSKPAPKKKPAQKTYNAPSNRAEVIAAALAVHRRERAHAQGVLQQALQELQAKPPRPSDLVGMTRLLSLRQAVLSMKGHMAHDLKRFKVLAGVKGLMESGGGGPVKPKSPKNPTARPPARPGSQGAKR